MELRREQCGEGEEKSLRLNSPFICLFPKLYFSRYSSCLCAVILNAGSTISQGIAAHPSVPGLKYHLLAWIPTVTLSIPQRLPSPSDHPPSSSGPRNVAFSVLWLSFQSWLLGYKLSFLRMSWSLSQISTCFSEDVMKSVGAVRGLATVPEQTLIASL